MKPPMPVFSIAAAAMILLASGCASNSSSTGPEPAFTLFVVQDGGGTAGNSVLQFPANGSGSLTPANSLTSPSQTSFDAVAVDTAGSLYVSASKGSAPSTVYQILVYAAGATGSATPARTITSTSLNSFINSIAVDATGDLYAISGNSIDVFAPNAAANAAPVRQIAGNLTQINFAAQIAVDAAQNIYLANEDGGNVLVFSSTQSGNIAPTGILTGASTAIGTPSGIAIDSSGDIYVASFNQPSNSSAVLEFAPGATGNAIPTRMLTTIASAELAGLAVDALDNLYVYTATGSQLAVDVFTPSQSGSSAASRTISSTAWTASAYSQIAVR
jgi:hypothetical protein